MLTFNFSTINNNDKKWHFNTRNHYKIWFSNNPNEFLDVENKLRLIQLIASNPSINFTFIYSSECLNESSQADLQSFCKSLKITPVDFSTETLDLLDDPQDIALYHLAKEEIDRTLTNQGGNFAAASDITRLIKFNIAKYGIYNDFENHLNIESYEPIIQCDAPIILKSDKIKGTMNNDTLAVAMDPSIPTQLAPITIEMINNAQNRLILNYNKKAAKILNASPFPRFFCPFSTMVIKEHLRRNPNSTLFDLRKFVQEVDFVTVMDLLNDAAYQFYLQAPRNTLSESQMKINFGEAVLKDSDRYKGIDPTKVAEQQFLKVRNNMLQILVVPFSGPDIMFELFKNKFGDFCTNHLDNCALQTNLSKMFVKTVLSKYSNGNEQKFDLSWTPAGAQTKRERSEHILKDIVTIQKAARQFLTKIRQKKSEPNFVDGNVPQEQNNEGAALGKRKRIN